MKCLVLFACVILVSCRNNNIADKNIPQNKLGNFTLIDSFGSVYRDTSTFQQLHCGLFINKAGVIGYQAIDRSMERPIKIYLVSIYYADKNDSVNGGLMEMNKVVDTSTFEILGDCYFKDKKHVYAFHRMMDGGTISINWDADNASFRILGVGIYAKDKRHCFYRGHLIKGADSKTFNVFKPPLYNCAYDKKHFYSSEEMMTSDEVKDSGFDTIRVKK